MLYSPCTSYLQVKPGVWEKKKRGVFIKLLKLTHKCSEKNPFASLATKPYLLRCCCSTNFSRRTTSRSHRKPPLRVSPRRPLYLGLAKLSLPLPVWLSKFRLQLSSCNNIEKQAATFMVSI